MSDNTFDRVFVAMRAGAALVYHDLLVVENVITRWTHDNPNAQRFVAQGVAFGIAFLTAHGIPLIAVELAESAVLSILREMAANDSTVDSMHRP